VSAVSCPRMNAWVGGRHHIPALCPQCPHCHAPDGHVHRGTRASRSAHARLTQRRAGVAVDPPVQVLPSCACELASIPSEAAWRFDGHQFSQVEIADRL
jgi:hypothetical protein